ncbi:MAG: hypothetical protein WC661_08810 [Opitutaceae bacterium]
MENLRDDFCLFWMRDDVVLVVVVDVAESLCPGRPRAAEQFFPHATRNVALVVDNEVSRPPALNRNEKPGISGRITAVRGSDGCDDAAL